METRTENYGVLLLNMGGPGSLDEVENYIFQLLADPDMIRMPLGFLLQKPFASMVARRRAPKVRERYGLIGGKSPIGEATAEQSRLLAGQIKLPVVFAMRYTDPSVETAISKLKSAGVTRFISIPLYPQYSTVSTLSSLKDLQSQSDGQLEYQVVDRHSNDKAYLLAMVTELAKVLEQADHELNTHLLFAAHSIPEAYITSGDPYADEVEQTMEQIHRYLGGKLPCSLAYQSRVGPVKWRGPTLDEELEKLVAGGVEQIIVQPLSFVSENLETLFDLDIDFKESCEKAGIKAMHRVPTLGNSPEYIKALGGLAQRAIESWEAADA